jgi:outer membrane protein OmpA-like peptidoglycan-associated protein
LKRFQCWTKFIVNTREKEPTMESLVKRMKTLLAVAVGFVLLQPLQLGAGDIPRHSGDIPRHSGDIPRHSGEVGKLAVQETPTEVRIELPGDVLFDFDKSELRSDAEPTLRQTAEIIQRYPRAQVAIAGYTDAKGADTYNLQLSKQRATSVKAWLVQQGGIDGKRITTKGWGEAKPVAPNTHPDGSDNPEGRQQNRRVELTVKK